MENMILNKSTQHALVRQYYEQTYSDESYKFCVIDMSFQNNLDLNFADCWRTLLQFGDGIVPGLKAYVSRAVMQKR